MNSSLFPHNKYIRNLFLVLFIIALLLSNCSKINKKEYLEEFEIFIYKIRKESLNYNKSGWKKADDLFKKYSDFYYYKFIRKLKPSEKLRVKRFIFIYNFYRDKIKMKDILNGKYNEELKEYLNEALAIIKEGMIFFRDIRHDFKRRIIDKMFDSIHIK